MLNNWTTVDNKEHNSEERLLKISQNIIWQDINTR